MRRISVVVLVVGLLVAGRTPAGKAHGSPPGPVPSSATALMPGRFVLPNGGYAVTFPEDWEVLELPVDWSSVPVLRAEKGHDGETSDAVPFCEIKVMDPCGDQHGRACATAVDEAARSEMSWWESEADIEVPAVIASEALVLPAGYAVRINVTHPERGLDRSMYYLTDGHVVASLLCMAARGPQDRWMSIAESFEFFPAEA